LGVKGVLNHFLLSHAQNVRAFEGTGPPNTPITAGIMLVRDFTREVATTWLHY